MTAPLVPVDQVLVVAVGVDLGHHPVDPDPDLVLLEEERILPEEELTTRSLPRDPGLVLLINDPDLSPDPNQSQDPPDRDQDQAAPEERGQPLRHQRSLRFMWDD